MFAVGSASPAAAAGEAIRQYLVTMRAQPDGSMAVVETLQYDFGSQRRHGIERVIPVRFALPDDDQHRRVYPVTSVQVDSPSGAPAGLDTVEDSPLRLRIGDPDRTVTGRQTYRLRYHVAGVVNAFPDHVEVYWNAIGTEWNVPVDRAAVTVSGPAAVTKVACFEGAQGSTAQCPARITGGVAQFSAGALAPGQAVTVVAAFPVSAFSNTAPVIEEVWSPQRAFSLTPATGVGGVGALALVLGGGGWLVARRGRDERYLGAIPGLAPAAGQSEATQRAGLRRREPVAVQFTPPKGARPGQLGTLLDEKADVVDVTATIVDLAVRGYLRIEEVEASGKRRGGDWRLVRTEPSSGGGAPLRPYEQRLLGSLFARRDEVLLSRLRTTFSSDLSAVRSMLYDDVTREGWFHGNPASVRLKALLGALAVVVVGVGLTVLLAARTRAGLVGVGVLLGGIVLLVLAPRMPARTAKGTAVLAQLLGFRLYLETAEAEQIRFEEGEDVFSRYLPYAIVFGVTERWAKVFAQLAASGVAVPVPYWYVGTGLFDLGGFGHRIDSFATVAMGSISAPTPSSSGGSGFSGGFSGGGGGGGGGGSW